MENIGERIYNLRKERGVSQEELAFALNVSRQTVSRWERNTVSPTLENLESLSNFFGVNSSYFIGEEIATAEEQPAEEVATFEEVKREPKFKTLKVMLAVLGIALFALGAVVCGIVAYVAMVPVQGQDVVTANRFNGTGIAFFIIGILALISAVTLTVLFIKSSKKTKM